MVPLTPGGQGQLLPRHSIFKLSELARIPCVLQPPHYPLFNHSALTKPDQSSLAGLSLLSLNKVTSTEGLHFAIYHAPKSRRQCPF